MSDLIGTYTDRLLQLAPDLGRSAAEGFVNDLYYAAQRDLDEEVAEAELEREE
ncbi:hypothetical protein [Kitasatospora sp. NPDC057198]|uniref:hypothetical protein n=1 Tax=Kitasatospora sp. NPDC057198 TaxID=3346046 RepID=UPI003638750D